MTKSEKRKLTRQENLDKLIKIKKVIPALNVTEFSLIHWRLNGEKEVDFWPTVNKAMITKDESHKIFYIGIEEAVQLACQL